MRPVNRPMIRFAAAAIFIALSVLNTTAIAQKSCEKSLYLTFDTGHMDIAPLVADVLKRQDVKVTFFAANERTRVGDGSLGQHWAPWWRARAAEGHEFSLRRVLLKVANLLMTPRNTVRKLSGPATVWQS